MPLEIERYHNLTWNLADAHLVAFLLLSLHWDRFVLESWRFKDFHSTFTLAYDVETFFNYPLFLYPTSLLIAAT